MHDRLQRLQTVSIVLLVGALAGACGDRHHEDHKVWTMPDIYAALMAGGGVASGPTLTLLGLPNGLPAAAILKKEDDGAVTLAVAPAFVDGQPAAYVTTELWINYQKVWLEPGYVQMSAPGTPLAGAGVLVDVGPASAFYSPFWQLKAAVVGNVEPNHYTSTRDLLDAGVPISNYALKTCPVRHPNVMPTPTGGHLVEPTWGTELDDIPIVNAYFDGNAVTAFGFGVSTFSANAAAEVQPIPFFLFLTVTAEGPRILTPVRVGGVGPLFSGAKADVGWVPSPKDPSVLWPQPHFGAFWRVYGTVVPASAAPFAAASNAAATVPPTVDIKDYEGRVALDSSCFNGDITLCTWLDSQAKIEQLLGAGALIPTEITGTCPLVFYNKLPVKH